MTNNQKSMDKMVQNREPFIQNNIFLQDDVNNRPKQISVNITNTINFNIARQIFPSNGHNATNIHMNGNTHENHQQHNTVNYEENEDDENDESEDDESESSQESEAAVSGAEILTPPKSENNDHENAN